MRSQEDVDVLKIVDIQLGVELGNCRLFCACTTESCIPTKSKVPCIRISSAWETVLNVFLDQLSFSL